MPIDPHRLAELRSLALHRVVLDRISGDPSVLARAVERMEEWRTSGRVREDIATRWLQVLDSATPPRLVEWLSADSEEARHMRGFSPFAGVVGPRERWALWKRVAEEHCESPATGGVTGICPSVSDLAISKLAAGREKDLDYVAGLLRAALTTTSEVEAGIAELSDPVVEVRLRDRLIRCATAG
ncbi:MAG: hypothetical protein H6699_04820 [Myxococcales bacterium]|nr:hypothetical protein [Myxococcales bacterium]